MLKLKIDLIKLINNLFHFSTVLMIIYLGNLSWSFKNGGAIYSHSLIMFALSNWISASSFSFTLL